MIRLVAITSLLLTSLTLKAQHDKVLQHKRVRVTPLPVIYYSPETRLGFGALVAANFETTKVPDSVTLGSYAQTYFLYTLNKQYDWGTLFRIYGPLNNYIFSTRLNYTYFPEYYWGISTEDPENNKDTIAYNRVGIDVRFYKAINKRIYAGVATRVNTIDNIQSEGDRFVADQPPGHAGYWVWGFAPGLTIETRDNAVYPRKGFFLEALFYYHPAWNTRAFAFQTFRLDARKYIPATLISNMDALALQLFANINTGDVPFKDMADIGGSNLMRGYYTGFYRYQNLYAFQAEYRAHVWWRIGFVAWIGAALTTDTWYRFFENPLKPNAGVGLRLMMNKKDRLNVRLDQGFGKAGQQGFYLDIAEAF